MTAKRDPRYFNEDGAFKNGFDGCVLYMQSQEGGGHSEESAKKICGAIAQGAGNAAPGAADESAGDAFALVQGDRMLIPYGRYPHEMGMQVMDRQAAESMAANLKSLWTRIKHGFAGLPLYVGHPDLDPKSYPDKRAYARIVGGDATDAGLDLALKWGNAGKELVADGAYAFYSPFWGMLKIGSEGGRALARPMVLYSVGLTNTPNIAVPALIAANEAEIPATMSDAATQKEGKRMGEFHKRLAGLFGLPDSSTEEEVATHAAKLHETAAKVRTAMQARMSAEQSAQNCNAANDAVLTLVLGNADAALQTVTTERDSLKTQFAAANTAIEAGKGLQTKLDEAGQKLTAANEALKTQRAAHAKVLIDGGITAGKIIAGDRDKWANEFAENFAATEAKLGQAHRIVPEGSLTRGVGARRPLNDSAQTFLDAVNDRVKKGDTFDVAWANCKKTHAALWEAMQQAK